MDAIGFSERFVGRKWWGGGDAAAGCGTLYMLLEMGSESMGEFGGSVGAEGNGSWGVEVMLWGFGSGGNDWFCVGSWDLFWERVGMVDG